jgi:hypothetical protein
MSGKGFHTEGVAETRMESAIARNENRKIKEKRRKKRYIRKRWFMRNIKFNCQLHRGDSKFPRTEEMTCVEMGEENKKLVQSYIKAMSEKKEARLWQWKIIDVESFKKAKEDYINSDIDCYKPLDQGGKGA